MENYTPLLQRLLEALDKPLDNNSYMWSLITPVTEDFTGTVLQWIIDTNEIEVINNNLIQSIAIANGVTETVNGSWLQALVELYETEEEGGGEDYG
jgi:hypothetical protein